MPCGGSLTAQRQGPHPRGTLDAFRSLRPAPSLSLAEAKELAAKMLDTVVVMKAGP